MSLQFVMSDNSTEKQPVLHWYSLSLPRQFQITVWTSLIITLGLSLLCLLGWTFSINFLKSFSVHWSAMSIVNAFSFVLVIVSLYFIQTGLSVLFRTLLPKVIAIIVLLISLITLYTFAYSYFTGNESGLPELPFLKLLLQTGYRLDFSTSFNLLFLGCILFLLPSVKIIFQVFRIY